MSEIKGFDLSRLTQDENFGFHSFAIVEFEKCKDSKITEFVNNYKVKYNVFDGSMKVSGGENVLSYDVTRLDKVRDDVLKICRCTTGCNIFDPLWHSLRVAFPIVSPFSSTKGNHSSFIDFRLIIKSHFVLKYFVVLY